jgi:hypothetical protein
MTVRFLKFDPEPPAKPPIGLEASTRVGFLDFDRLQTEPNSDGIRP